jgi:hypothetical protein
MSLPAASGAAATRTRARTRAVSGGARRWRTRPASRELLSGRVAEYAREAGALALERRLMPQGRGAIDALLVGPAGITVVETLLLDRSPRIARMAGGFAEPAGDRLVAGGRDHTGAVRAVERRALAVTRALTADGRADRVPAVRGALCLPEGLALVAFTELRLHDVLIDGPQTIAFLSARPGPLTPAQVRALATRLERAFPHA